MNVRIITLGKIAVIIILFLVLPSCSSSCPPEDIAISLLKDLTELNVGIKSSKLYLVERIYSAKITNKYNRKLNGEDYCVYEYDILYQGVLVTLAEEKLNDVSVAYIKRGNKWVARLLN